MKFLLAYLTVVSGAEKRDCKKELDSVCSELLCADSGTEGWVIESRNYGCTNHTIAKVSQLLENRPFYKVYDVLRASTVF